MTVTVVVVFLVLLLLLVLLVAAGEGVGADRAGDETAQGAESAAAELVAEVAATSRSKQTRSQALFALWSARSTVTRWSDR